MKKPLFISTYCCIDQPLEKALETLATRTSHVEILSDGLHDLRHENGPCSEYPLSYSVHAPSSEVNIAAVSERIRTASLQELGDVIAICNRIGAETPRRSSGIFTLQSVMGEILFVPPAFTRYPGLPAGRMWSHGLCGEHGSVGMLSFPHAFVPA